MNDARGDAQGGERGEVILNRGKQELELQRCAVVCVFATVFGRSFWPAPLRRRLLLLQGPPAGPLEGPPKGLQEGPPEGRRLSEGGF